MVVKFPAIKGTSGLFHSLPQRSQKKLNEKPPSPEWSVIFLVSGGLNAAPPYSFDE
jgi:hypothetical protein